MSATVAINKSKLLLGIQRDQDINFNRNKTQFTYGNLLLVLHLIMKVILIDLNRWQLRFKLVLDISLCLALNHSNLATKLLVGELLAPD